MFDPPGATTFSETRCVARRNEHAPEVKKEIALEIAHVLFIDIVGYSKLSISDQRAAVEELTRVRASEEFNERAAAV
jgi:hypothetical protein